MAAIRSASGDVNINVAQAAAAIRTLQSNLGGLGSTSIGSPNTSGFSAGMKGAEASVQSLSDKILESKAQITELGQNLTVFGAAITGALGVGIGMAANFEQGMDGAAAALGGVGVEGGVTEAQFKSLNDEALRIGASTSKSATESATAMELMAKAGIGVETIINGGAQAVVNLSEATSESLPQAASSLSSLFLLFDETGISVEQMADSITTAMNRSDATLSEFQTGMARLAPVVKGGSLAFEEASAAIAYFNSQGFGAAETGTSLASIFTSVVSPATDDASAALSELGVQAFNAQGEFVGYPALFDQVATATAGMTEKTKADILARAFQSDGLDLLTVASVETRAEMEALEADIARSGTAAEASAIRMGNFKGAMERFRGAIETVSIVVLSRFLPALTQAAEFADRLVSAFLSVPAPIQTAIAAFAGLVGIMSLAAGGMLLFGVRILEGRKAILDIANKGRAAENAITKLSTVFRSAGSAVLRLLNPLRLLRIAFRLLLGANPIFLALSLAILAFQTNFLGFGDAVRSVVGSVMGTISTFADGFKRAFDPAKNMSGGLETMFRALQYGFASIGLESFAAGFKRVADIVRQFTLGFKEAFNSLTGGEQATTMFGKLAVTVTKAGDGINKVAAFFYALADSIRAVNFGPFEGAANTVANGLDAIGGFIQNVIDQFNTFKSVFSGAFKALSGGEKAVVMFGDLAVTVTKAGTSINKVSAFFKSLARGIRAVKWGPFQDGADAVANGLDAIGDGIQKFIDVFQWARAATDPLTAALLALGAVFPGLVRYIQPLFTVITQLKDAFATLRSFGLNPVQAALLALGSVFPSLMGPVQDLMAAFDSWVVYVTALKDAFMAFMSGNFGEGFAKLGEAVKAALGIVVNLLQGLGGLLLAAFQAIDWGALGMAFLKGMYTVTTVIPRAILSAAQEVDWAAVGSALLSGAQTAVAYIVDLASDVWGWIEDSVADIPWATIGTALLTGAQTAIDYIVDLSSDIWGWIQDAASAIPWTTIGTQLWAGVTLATNALIDLALDIWGWIEDTLNDIDWAALGTTLLEGVDTAIAFLADLGSELLDEGAALIQGLVDGFEIAWPLVLGWLGAIASKIGPLLADAASWLLSAGAAAVQGIVDGFEVAWPLVTAWLGSLASKVPDALIGAGTWLLETGKTILAGLLEGLIFYYTTLFTVLGNLGMLIIDIFVGSGEWLLETGKMILAGLLKGIVFYYTTLFTVLGNLGALIIDIFVGAGTWLLETGAAIIQGLVNGFEVAWPIVSGWISALKEKVSGLISDAASWLLSAGAQVVQGLVNGLELAWPIVSGWISALKEKIIGLLPSPVLWLLSIGKSIIQGLYAGVLSFWDGTLEPWITTLGSQIVTAAGEMADTLLSAGTDLIDGLKAGIDEAWEAVVTFGEGIKDTVIGWFTFDIPEWDVPGITLPFQGGDDDGGEAAPAAPVADAAEVRALTDAMNDLRTAMAGIDTTLIAISAAFVSMGQNAVTAATGLVDFSTQSTLVAAEIAKIDTAVADTSTAVSTFVAETIGQMGAWSTAIPIFTGIVSAAFPVAETAINTAKQSFITFVADTIAVMGGWSTGIKTNTTNTMTAMRTAISSGTSTAKQSVLAFANDTKTAIVNWQIAFQRAVVGTMTNLKTQSSSGTSAAKQSVLGFTRDTTTAINAWEANMKSSATAALSGLKSEVRSGMSIAESTVRTGASAMVRAARSNIGNMRTAGADAMQGLVNGVISKHQSLRNAVNTALAIMARIPGMGDSPWPTMVAAGQDAIDGLVVGMDGRLGALQSQVSATTAAILTPLADMKAAAAKAMTGILDVPLATQASAVRRVITESKGWVIIAKDTFRTQEGMIVKALGTFAGDWERMTNGYWRNVKDDYVGIVRGIMTEDGSWVNPDFYGGKGYTAGKTYAQQVIAGLQSVTGATTAIGQAPITSMARSIAAMIANGGKAAADYFGHVLSDGDWANDAIVAFSGVQKQAMIAAGKQLEALIGNVGATSDVGAMDQRKLLDFLNQLRQLGVSVGKTIGTWQSLGGTDWINTVSGEMRRALKSPGRDYSTVPTTNYITLAKALESITGHLTQVRAIDTVAANQARYAAIPQATTSAAAAVTNNYYDQRYVNIPVSGTQDPTATAREVVNVLMNDYASTGGIK